MNELLFPLSETPAGAQNNVAVLKYHPTGTTKEYNDEVFAAFVATVLALEATNAPFYVNLGTTTETRYPESRIFDPETGMSIPGTSLFGFVDDQIRMMMSDALFELHESLTVEVEQRSNESVGQFAKVNVRDLRIDTDGFPIQHPVEQMMAAYLCNEGSYSKLLRSMSNENPVIGPFRAAICRPLILGTKRIFDVTSGLRERFDLAQVVSATTAYDTRNVIDVRLKELADIQLRQLKTLTETNSFLARISFVTEQNKLEAALRHAEALRRSSLVDLVDFGTSAVKIISGGSAFFAGAQALDKLLDAAPTDSWEGIRTYYWKNKTQFGKANALVTSGAGSLMHGLGAIDRIGRSQQAKKDVIGIRKEIEELVERKMHILSEMSETLRAVDGEWLDKAHEVLLARAVERSLIENVALILRATLGRRLINDLVVGEGFSGLRACMGALSGVKYGVKQFNPVPVLVHCDVGTHAKESIRHCLTQAMTNDDWFLGFETQRWILVVEWNTKARECFRYR